MFRLVLSVFALLAFSLSAQATTEAFFTEKVKDFGVTPRGPQLTHFFAVKNTSNETWSIGSVNVSCGCTQATALQWTLQPGQSTVIQAVMDSRRFTGFKQVTIFVRFHQPRYEEVQLVVRAVGRDDFNMFPDTIAFAPTPYGKSAAAKTTVSFMTDPNFQITSAVCESSFVQPEIKQLRRNGADVAYEIVANVRGDLPVGKWFTEITASTNNATMPKIRIPLTIEVTSPPSPVAVTPANISFGEVKKGDNAEQRLMLRGDKPFRITEVKGAEHILVGEPNKDAKTMHVVTLKIDTSKTGELAGNVTIKTDAGDSHRLSVPVKAVVKE